MDDQFGGRTDDDLFADDFEPVAAAADEPSTEVNTQTEAASTQPTTQENQPTPAPSAPPRSLAQSRHNKPSQPRPARQTAHQPAAAQATPGTAAPAAAPTGPKNHTPAGPKVEAAGGPARLQSGANPRTKLTDAELNAKMEAMAIASAEKSRKFEQQQRDERDHELAYTRSLEEQRKRKAADEERRKRDQEHHRRMEDERSKNRERKLKAMGMKEGGWDDGKQEREEEERRRGAFRGAYGGVRGERGPRAERGERFSGRGSYGLAMERFLAEPAEATHLAELDTAADVPTQEPVRELDPNEFRGRGRGPRRGTPGRGRGGGRGGHGDHNDRNGGTRGGREKPAAKPEAATAKPPDVTGQDFPALPPGTRPTVDTPAKLGFQPLPGKKNDAAAVKANAPLVPLSPLSPVRWDEDVAANEAKMATGGQS